MRRLVTQAGRRAYTFVVGKINAAKLSNFPEVDVFVLVACPENALLDSRDFYKVRKRGEGFELKPGFSYAMVCGVVCGGGRVYPLYLLPTSI